MKTQTEALKLALDFIIATNKSSQFWLVPESNLNKTVTAIKEALAQPEQEPVAWFWKQVYTDGYEWKHMADNQADADKFLPHQVIPLYTTPPQRKPLTDEQPMYYLQDTRGYVGNCPLWWGLNGNGYTTDLRKAQKYTLAEAMSQHRCRDSDLPWLCSEIDAIQRPTIDVQDMHKMRSVDDQRSALQAAHGIKE